ncbi:hypothetical protein KQI77_06775 [Clostridium sp. MSJ-8]|uniref:Vpu n=1 Tax=Clostridium sp. MSJ-8 TaxID=2841510 RepID=UPI001C0F00F3|nr:Vpu [Clostridium sp. MSJ-8]MBU5487872.1 hypothetical protein [Clostridium sp. MSJ-8]
MKNKKLIISIIISVVIVACILVGGLVAFRIYKNKEQKREISNYSRYIKNKKDDFDNLVLGDKETKYEDLIKESQDIINNNKVSQINTNKTDLDALYDKIAKNNEEDLTEEIRDIEKMDISNLYNEESIQKYIDKVDQYINSKKYQRAKDYIDKINILIEKGNNKYAAEEAEIRTAENVKVNDYIASRANVEDLIRGFLEHFPEAVNENDFSEIAYYLYPNSTLYNDQKAAIKSWYDQGIKEEFLGFTAKDITFSSDKLEGTVIDEEVFNITNSKGTTSKTFTWKYTFKYNTDIENYQISEISNV